MFAKAGVANPPKTWKEMEEVSRKLLASGAKCGFSTTWQSWTQIENFGARNNVPVANNNNGFAGLDTEFKFNDSAFVRHINQMGKWSKKASSNMAVANLMVCHCSTPKSVR